MKDMINAMLRRLLALKRPSKQSNVRRLAIRGEALDDFTIREATVDDVVALARLHVKAWAETYFNVSRPPTVATREWQWRDQFKTMDGTWFCLVIENKKGQLIGFAKGNQYRHDELPAYAGELNKLYLLSAYQRLGLGRKLVRAVAKRFLAMGIGNMVLFGSPQNPSCYFHEAMGGERLYAKNGEFHGGYGWKELQKLVLLFLLAMISAPVFS